MVETDASNYVTAGIMLQLHPNDIWQPVAYFSKKMTGAECNYEIFDKELLAVVASLKEWGHYVQG